MNQFVSSSYGKLRKVLLCEPSHYKLMPSNETSKAYLDRGEHVDIALVIREHKALAEAIGRAGAEVVWVRPHAEMPYQVFTRDLGATTARGVLLGSFHWPFRGEELEAAIPAIEKHVPIWERVPAGEGVVFEGGDFIYMNSQTVALGLGSRTTRSGAEIVRREMAALGVEVISVPFAATYCHLDMVFNVVAERVCVACTSVLPEGFLSKLRGDKWEVLTTTPEDVLNLLGNLFAVDNGKVISPDHNDRVNSQLRSLGIEVIEVEIRELLKGGGGPHCMTFPLVRDAA